MVFNVFMLWLIGMGMGAALGYSFCSVTCSGKLLVGEGLMLAVDGVSGYEVFVLVSARVGIVVVLLGRW